MAKGELTRSRILERAFRLAGREGLSGLTIGALASDLGLSKSGLFAHFGSKEDLDIAVLDAASQRFIEMVAKPAALIARADQRVRKLFELWLSWASDPALPGGCVFIAASVELDDREGRARDFLVGTIRQLLNLLASTARQAVEQGHFRKDLDCETFAFDLYAIVLGYHHAKRLLRDDRAEERVRAAFDRLFQYAAPTSEN